MGVLNWMDLTISPVRREYRSAQLYGGLALQGASVEEVRSQQTFPKGKRLEDNETAGLCWNPLNAGLLFSFFFVQ